MINYAAVNKLVLNELTKDRFFNLRYQIKEGKVYIVLEGYRLFVIPEDKFFINLSGVKEVNAQLLLRDDVEIGKLTGNFRICEVNDKEITVSEVKVNNRSVYVDTKLLKEFGKITSIGITAKCGPVYLYDGEEFMGMVMPVKVSEPKGV